MEWVEVGWFEVQKDPVEATDSGLLDKNDSNFLSLHNIICR